MLSLLTVLRRGYREWGYPGLYIIMMASLIHFGWACLLTVNSAAADAIPIAILYSLLPYRAAVVLLLFTVSILSGIFLHFYHHHGGQRIWAILCIPQQIVLLFSAGAGIYASINQYLIVRRLVPSDLVIPTYPWAHTLATELPVIVLAVLYVIAMMEFQRPFHPQNSGGNITPET